MRGDYSKCPELSSADRAFLDRVVANLPLLADLLHADLLLYARSGDAATAR